MSGALRIRISGVDFFGQGSHDFVISPDGFSGWDDGVDMRRDDVGRPQQHGSYDGPGYLGSRVVSISGYSIAASNQQLRANGDRLRGILAGGGLGRVQVDRDGEIHWADCRLASKTKFDERGGQNMADFQIQLWCPDPLKYGETRTYAASVGANANGVRHYGNFDATPRFVVAGSMPGGYVLTLMGVNFYVTWPLVSGHPHSIDYADGQLWVDGVQIHGGLGITNTPTIPAGANTALGILPLTSGTATATMTVLDTFI